MVRLDNFGAAGIYLDRDIIVFRRGQVYRPTAPSRCGKSDIHVFIDWVEPARSPLRGAIRGPVCSAVSIGKPVAGRHKHRDFKIDGL
jgi:hypothetical protein